MKTGAQRVWDGGEVFAGWRWSREGGQPRPAGSRADALALGMLGSSDLLVRAAVLVFAQTNEEETRQEARTVEGEEGRV